MTAERIEHFKTYAYGLSAGAHCPSAVEVAGIILELVHEIERLDRFAGTVARMSRKPSAANVGPGA